MSFLGDLLGGFFAGIGEFCRGEEQKPVKSVPKSAPKSVSKTAAKSNSQAVARQPAPQVQKNTSYSARSSIMTECEKDFYAAIKSVVGQRYIVQPQVNLASVVKKEIHSRYQNELFRNVDFGIFDGNYRLKVLIEINDKSHERYDRRQRDQKVRQICSDAGIPIVTLWTKYGVNRSYIQQRLSQYLNI